MPIRLLAVSDLHIGVASNRAALTELPDHGDDWLIVAGDVGEKLEQREAERMLSVVLSRMRDKHRTVFVLFEIEEISIQDIATTLEIPIGTVGSRLRRARQAFQQAVTRHRARIGFRQGAVG